MCEEQDHCTCTLHVRIIFLYVSSLYNIASQPNIEFLFIYLQQNLTLDCIGLDIDICIVISHRKTLKSDMEKVKKCTLGEFLGFIISTKKNVILDMSKAMEKCKNCSIFLKLHIRNLFYWSLNGLHSTGHLQRKAAGTNNVFD